MKLNSIFALLLVFPFMVSRADSHNVNLTVKGVAYKSCTVSAETTIEIGEHKSSNWVPNEDYLSPASREATVTLSNCDASTIVRVSASGTAVSASKFILKNLEAEQNLMATLQVYVTTNNTWRSLALDGSNYFDVVTIASSSDTQKIKIRALLRRPNINISPVGDFRATPTLIINFL